MNIELRDENNCTRSKLFIIIPKEAKVGGPHDSQVLKSIKFMVP